MIIEVMRVGSREVYRRKSKFGENVSFFLYCFFCGFTVAWIIAVALRLLV